MRIDEPENLFREIYDEHFDDVLRYCQRRTTVDIAVDVAAETFLTAWKKMGDVPQGKEAKYWLLAVARRTLANSHRKQLNKSRLGDKLKEDLQMTETFDFERDFANREAVINVLRELNDEDHELVTLSFWEELNSKEIAKVLDLPAATVRTRLRRIRRDLKDKFEENPDFIKHL